MTAIPPDRSITDLGTDLELRRAVRRTIEWAIGETIQGTQRSRSGPVPAIGTPEWFEADNLTRLASILLLGEQWLVHDPDRAVAERLRAMSWDLSEAMRGRHGGPSHVEFERRRAEPGPNARSVDRGSLARWVSTGCSDGGEVPAA